MRLSTDVGVVFGGTVTRHPITNYTLPSITRKTTLELCEKQAVPVDD